jgi:hypothetical protein
MGNLGKIIAKVVIGANDMPGMPTNPIWHSVQDVTAKSTFRNSNNNTDGRSPDIEFIHDDSNDGYMAIPLRQYRQVNNYVTGASSSPTFSNPLIMWDVLTKNATDPVSSCIGSPYIEQFITNTAQIMLSPSSPPPVPIGYAGPIWENPFGEKVVLPKDTTAATTTSTATGPVTAAVISRAYAAQQAISQDIWWAIETTSLNSSSTYSGTGNPPATPFYIDIAMKTPLASKQPTFLAIRIGKIPSATSSTSVSSTAQEVIDLVFVNNQGGGLYDWGNMTGPANPATPSTPSPVSITLPENVRWDGSSNRIGFLPLAGRLLISVNGVDFLYTRIVPPNSAGSTSSANAAQLFFPTLDKVRIIGSNSQASISLGAIAFNEKSVLQTPLSAGFNVATQSADMPLFGSQIGVYDPSQAGTISLVEMPDGTNTSLGAWAEKCTDSYVTDRVLTAPDAWGSEASNYMFGKLTFGLENDAVGSSVGIAVTSGTGTNKHYSITFEPDWIQFGLDLSGANDVEDAQIEDILFPNMTPIWFRARGVTAGPMPASNVASPIDVSDDVMDLTESFSSSDRYHCEHTMDIVLYNEDGQYNTIGESSQPVQAGYTWKVADSDVVTENVFTGLILNASKTLTAGKETITLHCEDYMFLLGATLMINSPFYDGMDGFYVVKDLAMKAGLDTDSIHDDSGTGPNARYFLPSGYSFAEPAKRYDSKSNVKDNMLDVCSMGSKVVYFDGDGELHYDNIQGGIFFTTPATGITIPDDLQYFSDPSSSPSGGGTLADTNIILDEKREEVKLNSVVNLIYVKSVDRNTGALLSGWYRADPTQDRLSYRKIIYCQIPSLGSVDAVNNYMADLKSRVFKPIRGITIKTADDSMSLKPMTFISVDSEIFRLMGINRSFRVEDNSITTSMTGEWMGDQ